MKQYVITDGAEYFDGTEMFTGDVRLASRWTTLKAASRALGSMASNDLYIVRIVPVKK